MIVLRVDLTGPELGIVAKRRAYFESHSPEPEEEQAQTTLLERSIEGESNAEFRAIEIDGLVRLPGHHNDVVHPIH